MNNCKRSSSFENIFTPLSDKKSICLIVIIGFVVFFNILFNGFVWDDITYIINNPEIKIFNLARLVGRNMFNSSGYFRPLPAVYFSLLFNVFGNTAFFYHLIQLLLHITDSIIFFYIFKYFFKKPLALFLTLIFLIHPINVESVAYIGASQSVLYFLFGGLAFLFSLKTSLTDKKVITIHILLLCALLTKEVSILFFLVIYLYRYLFKKHLPIKFLLSTLGVIFIYLVIRFAVLGTILQKMHLIPISEIPMLYRLTHIPIILFYYLKTFFFPKVLAIDQIWTISAVNRNNFFFPLIFDFVFIAGILGVLIYFFRRRKRNTGLFLLFFIWFLAGMALLFQIFPLDMTVADRWFYFPIVGLLGLLGIIIDYIFSKVIDKQKFIFLSGAALLLIILSIRTVIRNANWLNSLTLYGHDVKYYDNYDIENFLGVELASLNRNEEALPHLIKSSQLLPHDTNLFNVGSVYEKMKDYQNAKLYYEKALEIKGNNDNYLNHKEIRKFAYEGSARILILQSRWENIGNIVEKGLNEFPENGSLWAYLAIGEYNLDHYDQALLAAEKANKFLKNPSSEKLYNMILNKEKLNLRYE